MIQPAYRWIMAFLAISAALYLVGASYYLLQKRRLAYFAVLACLFLIALLALFDELGLVDWIVFFITLAPIVMLIKDRKWYRPGTTTR